MRTIDDDIKDLKSITFISYTLGFICDRPLLGGKQRFPDSSFTASASSEGRSPSDARKSSGSSWCAPAADGKHYLQVDLGRLYVIYYFVTFGDSTSPKWVTTYNVNYTVDLINWKSIWNQPVIAMYIILQTKKIIIYFVVGRQRINLKNRIFSLLHAFIKPVITTSSYSKEDDAFTIVFRSRETKMLTMMQPCEISLDG